MNQILTHGLFLTCTKNLFLLSTHQYMFKHYVEHLFKYENKNHYLEWRFLDNAGETTILAGPLLEVNCPLRTPSPPIPMPIFLPT
jgi:hypothetical protein